MKHLHLLTVLFFFAAVTTSAQSVNDLLVGGSIDVIKSDIDNAFEKGQLGFEANYFATRDLSISAGAELWTDDNSSFAFGMRYYFNDQIFMRARGLIGDNDFSIGAGWVKPVWTDFRFEGLADFYFEGTFAIRAGLAYIIRVTH